MKKREDKKVGSPTKPDRRDDLDLDDFEMVGHDESSSEDKLISENELNVDDFEFTITNETTQESILYDEYAPKIQWDINQGMNPVIMHKLYGLLADKNASFYLKNIEAEPAEEESDFYKFNSTENGNKVVLFKPGNIQATYATSSRNKNGGELTDGFVNALSTMMKICQNAETPIRFDIPFTEKPDNQKKGESHFVLLVVDYDPVKKTIMPQVLDSMGRGTVFDELGKFFQRKVRTTADEILNKTIKSLSDNLLDDMKVIELNRIAYDHQNRATEGNCGSYAFVSIFNTIQSFATGESMDEFVQSIPSSGLITSDSYLDAELRSEIQSCVNFRSFESELIDSSLKSIGEDKSMGYELKEFEDALNVYILTKESEAKKSKFNSSGNRESSKVTAAKLLIEVLHLIYEEQPVPYELFEQLKNIKSKLHHGRLGELINFHLEKSQHTSIDSLIFSTKKVTTHPFKKSKNFLTRFSV